ncbi:hypothetical protein [uncultured Holdemanella sp.]|uniref:hypothetical protein n=1 Tax=uncultured Holdemanella sp. TaxID=1763549 RepID=UPI0025E7CF6E|nr:hypothetical protein [uncultured Holdemanella sp.]
MYYVVDQSNPKEPMEYIRVTRKDIYELKEIQIYNFVGKPINDDEISLCQYVLEDIEVPSYYDTKPARVGTMYTHLLNMYKMSLDNQYNINFYNDIDFILFFENIQKNTSFYNDNYSNSLIKGYVEGSFAHPSEEKDMIIIGKFIMNPPIKESFSQSKILNNYHTIYSFYHDFTDFETSFTFIFKKFMIQALKTLINVFSSTNYNSFFETSGSVNAMYRFYRTIRSRQEYPYSVITNYIDEIKNLISKDISISGLIYDYFLEYLLQFLNNLLSKYQSSLYIDDDFTTINLDESIRLMVEIYFILDFYQSMFIQVSNYNDFFEDFTNFTFEKYENLVSYRFDFQRDVDMYHRWDNFEELCELLHNVSLNNETSEFEHQQGKLRSLPRSMSRIYSQNIPLEYLILPRFFFLLINKINAALKKNENENNLSICNIKMEGIDIEDIIYESVILYQDGIISDKHCISENDDIPSFIFQSMQNQVLKNKKILYYDLNIHNIIDLFKPAIEAYLLFSKHPIDKCSHCHMFFLKTSPNRKFCDSALTLKSGMTCKEEREAITDHKSEYQKTTNDFKQYLQKVTLKGDEPYTRRVYNILEKNKYFDPKKTKNFEEKPKMSKSDTKDLLWMLNSFFNYSYAIMESMNFQKIVKDPTFKDIRYYNNSPEINFTPDAYKELFEEYKKYTRTNKGNGATEIINIYDSLVEFSKDKDSVLNFKTIRSKSMQKLNGVDIANLFDITEKVIHVFFLKLEEWYIEADLNLEDTKKLYPEFTYAFPKEYKTSELSNIQYTNNNADYNIEKLEEKIDKTIKDPYIDEHIKNNILINNKRELKIKVMFTNLEDAIIKNHPVK